MDVLEGLNVLVTISGTSLDGRVLRVCAGGKGNHLASEGTASSALPTQRAELRQQSQSDITHVLSL